ncbi:MAG: type II secretion system protein [bacterium]
MSSRNGGTSGFTLIEFMIVVVIIGILASIGITNYLAKQDKIEKENLVRLNGSAGRMVATEKAEENDGLFPLKIAEYMKSLDNIENPCGGYAFIDGPPPDKQDKIVPGACYYEASEDQKAYTITMFGKHKLQIGVLTNASFSMSSFPTTVQATLFKREWPFHKLTNATQLH